MFDFEWFYRNTKAMLYQYLYQHVKDFHETEDIAQETYLMALEDWDTLKEHPNPAGWLMLTAKHLACNFHRHIYNRMESLEEWYKREVTYTEPAFDMVVMEDLLERIYKNKDKEIAKRYFLEGDTMEELARDFGVSESTFRSRIYRMRRRMKSYIESYNKL